jgi:hypothetical protein
MAFLEIAAVHVFDRYGRHMVINRNTMVTSNDFDLMDNVYLLRMEVIFINRLRGIENRFPFALRTI